VPGPIKQWCEKPPHPGQAGMQRLALFQGEPRHSLTHPELPDVKDLRHVAFR
jgi:hypothetical protein